MHLRSLLWGCLLAAMAALPAHADSLQACGRNMNVPAAYDGRIGAICGLHAPEDFQAMPDLRHIVISDMRMGNAKTGGLYLLDVASGQIAPLARVSDRGHDPIWGDAACPDVGAAASFAPHGIHISTRPDGAVQLLVITHSTGERIEFYQLKQQSGQIIAAWRGCVATDGKGLLNAVADLPGGGFVASVSFSYADAAKPNGMRKVFSGIDTGYLLTWSPGSGLRRLPHSEAAFNNGVETSPDGRLIYVAAWSANQIDVYDRAKARMVRRVKLPFAPDNLRQGPHGTIIAAGVSNVDAYLENPPGVNQSFVSAWDPATNRVEPLFHAAAGLLRGTTTGLWVGRDLYVTSVLDPLVLKIAPSR